MNRSIAAFLAAALLTTSLTPAFADPAASYPTTPMPAVITAGGTYQVLFPATTQHRSMTMENNNVGGSDTCYLLIGGPWQVGDTLATSRAVSTGNGGAGVTLTAAKASYTIAVNAAYTRYYPITPNDQVLVTCTTTGDSAVADVQ